jgi:hypothetical protein
MKPAEVVTAYCELSREVQGRRFGFSVAADCFCDAEKMKNASWSYEPAVLEYIQAAVRERLDRDGRAPEEDPD